MDRVAELANDTERDPAEVARRARELAREFRDAEDWCNLSRAQAVLGRAWRMLGEVDLARTALDEAIAVATRTGADELVADAHLALSGVLSLGAAAEDAFRHLDEVDRLGTTTLRDSAALQRGVLCLRSGRVSEALELFDRAVPRLRRDNAAIDLARVLANRGGILLRRGDVRAAIADFEEAERLFEGLGQHFAALQVHHNLACAVAGSGDLPAALRLFDETSTGFAELDHDDSIPLLSRAEALLADGLSADAFDYARDAARRLQAEGNHSAATEALIAVAESARREGDTATAIDAVHRAKQWFESAGSQGWWRAAELLASRIRLDAGCVDRSTIDDMAKLAVSARAADDVRGEVSALALASVASCELGDLNTARTHVAAASRAARRSRLVQTRIAVLHARATCCLTSGDRAGARRSLRRALDLVDSTVVPGVVLAGADVTVDAHDIAQLSFRMAASERDPVRALEWMERSRAAASNARPPLPPESGELAELFARLRVVSGDLRRAEVEGRPTAELRHRQAELERTVRSRDLTRSVAARHEVDIGKPSDLRILREMIGRRSLVSMAATGDRLIAVVVDSTGFRSVELGSLRVVSAYASRARAALNGLARSDLSETVAATHRVALRTAVAGLDAGLVAPLALTSEEVALTVPPNLHTIPWASLPGLRSRALSLVPSASWWMRSSQLPPPPLGRAVVVAGPRLRQADSEANDVAGCHRRAVVLRGADASVERTCRGLADADIAHIVAHGRFRHDNPLWSTIELADGMLTLYELERLESVPSTIVLATCESGLGATTTANTGGASLHGLAATLLSIGARTVVASIGALPDTVETRTAMVGLHGRLASGVTAARALAEQRGCSGREWAVDADDVVSAGLVTLGGG